MMPPVMLAFLLTGLKGGGSLERVLEGVKKRVKVFYKRLAPTKDLRQKGSVRRSVLTSLPVAGA